MRRFNSSFVGLVMTGILALAPTAAFAHGGGGGGFGGGGGHFDGFAGHSFAGHSFTQYQGAHFAGHGDHLRNGRNSYFGYDYPYYGYDDPDYSYDYPDYGYYYDNSGDYSNGSFSSAEVAPSQGIITAVQKKLTQLGYYHGRINGFIGPQTESAIRWFQSVDGLPVTGQIDEPTLQALRIS